MFDRDDQNTSMYNEMERILQIDYVKHLHEGAC